MKDDAVISTCGKYRYALWRVWDSNQPTVMFVGLNPSTADATKDDQTIRRLIAFAKTWNFGSLSVGNLFAYRATKTTDLWQAEDPIGPDNDRWLLELAGKAKLIVAAWGDAGQLCKRDRVVMGLLPTLHCLKLSAKGNPRHPLYVSGNLKPQKSANHRLHRTAHPRRVRRPVRRNVR